MRPTTLWFSERTPEDVAELVRRINEASDPPDEWREAFDQLAAFVQLLIHVLVASHALGPWPEEEEES